MPDVYQRFRIALLLERRKLALHQGPFAATHLVRITFFCSRSISFAHPDFLSLVAHQAVLSEFPQECLLESPSHALPLPAQTRRDSPSLRRLYRRSPVLPAIALRERGHR